MTPTLVHLHRRKVCCSSLGQNPIPIDGTLMSMGKAGSGWSSPVLGLSLRDRGFQGVSPGDTVQVMANPLGAPGRASAAVWGLTGAVFLPHSHCPHLLLLQLHGTHDSTQIHRLCLHDQQHLPPASGDVSAQHCQGSGCDSQGKAPSVSKGGQQGERGMARDTWGTASGTQRRHPTDLTECPNVGFLPAAWSPGKGGRCARTPRCPGCRHI